MVIYGLQHISSSPHVQRAKSIVFDSLLISNRGYMNPPPQRGISIYLSRQIPSSPLHRSGGGSSVDNASCHA